jgi:hypothetical protein
MKKCAIEDCPRPHYARTWCKRHYGIWLRHKDPKVSKRVPGKGTITADGYRRIYRPNHPNRRKDGWLFEHVVVMSEILGRPLLPGEQVHHRNGVRDDNRRENLELWVVSQPAGQRPSELVAWAREILQRYGEADWSRTC